MYKTIVYVGVFRELYTYELPARKLFIIAWIFAKVELIKFPLRAAIITRTLKFCENGQK